MLIRHTHSTDAEAIRAMTLQLNVSRDALVSSGFVEFPVPSIAAYQKYITNNHFCFVALDNEKTIGFITGYADTFLTQLASQDAIAAYVLKKFPSCLYAEQLGVLSLYQHKGIGTQLYKTLIKKAASQSFIGVVGAVAFAPLKNTVSIDLHNKLQFQFVEEITTHEQLTFGIYFKQL